MQAMKKLSGSQEMHLAHIISRLNEQTESLEHFANKYNEEVQNYNDILQEAISLRDEIVSDAIHIISSHGEESTPGTAHADWVETWEDLELEDVNEIEEFEASHATDLSELAEDKAPAPRRTRHGYQQRQYKRREY
jgi:lambda repressor-like predicted transcriptional regulator